MRSFLDFATPYRLVMRLLANQRNRLWFVDEVLGAREGDKLVDVGCGPADILRRLPRVNYVGCDISESYIEAARQEFGANATFIAGRSEDWARDQRTHDADIVLAHGVLHHVDDEEFHRILQFAYRVLKPGGRFVFYEPCYLVWQSRLSAYFMSRDRGQYIRGEHEWRRLVERVFPNVKTSIVAGANRLGYTCIIGECYKERPAG